MSCFVHLQLVTPWKRYLHVVIYRKRVHHQSRKNFQLVLFDPDDGHYEYSANLVDRIRAQARKRQAAPQIERELI